MQSPAVLLSKYSLRLNKCVGFEVGVSLGKPEGSEVGDSDGGCDEICASITPNVLLNTHNATTAIMLFICTILFICNHIIIHHIIDLSYTFIRTPHVA